MMFNTTDAFFKGIQGRWFHYGLWEMVPLCYCERDETMFLLMYILVFDSAIVMTNSFLQNSRKKSSKFFFQNGQVCAAWQKHTNLTSFISSMSNSFRNHGLGTLPVRKVPTSLKIWPLTIKPSQSVIGQLVLQYPFSRIQNDKMPEFFFAGFTRY